MSDRPADVGDVFEVVRWGHYDGATCGVVTWGDNAYYYELAPWSDVVQDEARDFLLYDLVTIVDSGEKDEPVGRFSESNMEPVGWGPSHPLRRVES